MSESKPSPQTVVFLEKEALRSRALDSLQNIFLKAERLNKDEEFSLGPAIRVKFLYGHGGYDYANGTKDLYFDIDLYEEDHPRVGLFSGSATIVRKGEEGRVVSPRLDYLPEERTASPEETFVVEELMLIFEEQSRTRTNRVVRRFDSTPE